jgi:hypothetical protein
LRLKSEPGFAGNGLLLTGFFFPGFPPVYKDFGAAHATFGVADYVYFVSNSAILAIIRVNDD